MIRHTNKSVFFFRRNSTLSRVVVKTNRQSEPIAEYMLMYTVYTGCTQYTNTP